MRVAVLGGALPPSRFEEVVADDSGMPVQTQRFGLDLLRALESAGCINVMVTNAPALNYPHNKRLRYETQNSLYSGTRFVEIGFINLPLLKHVSRLWTGLRRGLPAIRAHGSEVVVAVGVNSALLLTALVAGSRLRIPAVVVLTDPPNVQHAFDTAVTRRLKIVDARLIRRLLAKFDGAIVLAEPLARDFAPGIPYSVMEGIAPSAPPTSREGKPAGGSVPLVVYAGGVSEEYGVGILAEAARLGAGTFHVVIAGKGPMADDMLDCPDNYPCLSYAGLLDATELSSLYAEASVLVNPRPTDAKFVRFSFPSKLLEYMASGRPVVSTRLPSIPDEYWNHITATEASPAGLAQTITEVTTSQQEAEARAVTARDFAITEKGIKAQGRRMAEFLNHVVQREVS